MTFDLSTLMIAARQARRASTNGKVVTISITEDGFVVLGAKDGQFRAIDVSWYDMAATPDKLDNAVRLIAERIP